MGTSELEEYRSIRDSDEADWSSSQHGLVSFLLNEIRLFWEITIVMFCSGPINGVGLQAAVDAEMELAWKNVLAKCELVLKSYFFRTNFWFRISGGDSNSVDTGHPTAGDLPLSMPSEDTPTANWQFE
jgi:hypothetical protein